MERENTTNDRFSFFSLNAYLVPSFFLKTGEENFCINVPERAAMIARIASQYSLISLQELWGPSTKAIENQLALTHDNSGRVFFFLLPSSSSFSSSTTTSSFSSSSSSSSSSFPSSSSPPFVYYPRCGILCLTSVDLQAFGALASICSILHSRGAQACVAYEIAFFHLLV
jgi:hypothetical protein